MLNAAVTTLFDYHMLQYGSCPAQSFYVWGMTI